MNAIDEREELKRLLNAAAEQSTQNNLVVIDDTQMNLPAPRYDAKTYVARCIKLNKSEEDILNSLKYNYLLSDVESSKILKEVKKKLRAQYKEYVAQVAEKNILTLQQILDDCLANGQYKTAIEAVKELNRMSGIGVGNTFVQNNTQINNFDNVEIVFK